MIRSISAKAECSSPTGRYTTRIDSIRGGRVRLEQTSDRGRWLAFTDGSRAWSVDEDDVVRPGDDSLRHAVLNHDFQMLALEPERLASPVHEDGRLVGFDTFDSRDPSRTISVRFREWCELEGERVPSLVVVTSHEGDFVLRFDSLEANTVREPLFPGAPPAPGVVRE